MQAIRVVFRTRIIQCMYNFRQGLLWRGGAGKGASEDPLVCKELVDVIHFRTYEAERAPSTVTPHSHLHCLCILICKLLITLGTL